MIWRLLYWLAVLAVSLALVAALILFFETHDGASLSALVTAGHRSL
ncbi:MAG: hypothetical protein ACYDHH_05260 [Solirubrobacteraceae bacterium]